jgi:hypothetical protein
MLPVAMNALSARMSISIYPILSTNGGLRRWPWPLIGRIIVEMMQESAKKIDLKHVLLW